MSRILCPVDFSETSRRSLHCAVDLARRHRGELTVVHVIPHTLPPLSGLAVQTSGSLEDGTRSQLRRDLLEELKLFSQVPVDGVAVHYLVDEGSVVDTIVARADDADLLVLGTHGHGGLEKLILGSVTEKALHKSPCPVLTVPPGETSRQACAHFKRILCAMDFSPASERALSYAVALAKESDGRVTLIHVIEGLLGDEPPDPQLDVRSYLHKAEEQVRERLRSALSGADSKWQQPEALVATGKANVEILSAIEERHFDLVALGAHGRTGLGELLFGSTARHVVRGASCPVLTIAPTAD